MPNPSDSSLSPFPIIAVRHSDRATVSEKTDVFLMGGGEPAVSANYRPFHAESCAGAQIISSRCNYGYSVRLSVLFFPNSAFTPCRVCLLLSLGGTHHNVSFCLIELPNFQCVDAKI
jgi:hypothetical protein